MRTRILSNVIAIKYKNFEKYYLYKVIEFKKHFVELKK